MTKSDKKSMRYALAETFGGHESEWIGVELGEALRELPGQCDVGGWTDEELLTIL